MVDYSEGEILRLIRNYAKNRSSVELTATVFDREYVTGGEENRMESLHCMLIDLDRARGVLTSKQKQAVMLTMAGMTEEEAAGMLGISRQKVGTRLARAAQRIKEFLCGNGAETG